MVRDEVRDQNGADPVMKNVSRVWKRVCLDVSEPLSQIVPASFMSSNRLPASMTVGQWRAFVSGKIGGAAGQSVLT
jgi:hypothetical protein